MRTYAIIEEGVVAGFMQADSAIGESLIDVTNFAELPAIGTPYDPVGGFMPELLPTPYMSHFGFLSRFTAAQRLAIRDRCDKSSPNYDSTLDDAIFLFQQAERIDVSLGLTQQLVGYMAATGLIAESDVSALLAPIPSNSIHAKV